MMSERGTADKPVRVGTHGCRTAVWALLALAMLVWVCAVYGRYHYAADGLASAAVSTLAALALLAHRARSGTHPTNLRV